MCSLILTFTLKIFHGFDRHYRDKDRRKNQQSPDECAQPPGEEAAGRHSRGSTSRHTDRRKASCRGLQVTNDDF